MILNLFFWNAAQCHLSQNSTRQPLHFSRAESCGDPSVSQSATFSKCRRLVTFQYQTQPVPGTGAGPPGGKGLNLRALKTVNKTEEKKENNLWRFLKPKSMSSKSLFWPSNSSKNANIIDKLSMKSHVVQSSGWFSFLFFSISSFFKQVCGRLTAQLTL